MTDRYAVIGTPIAHSKSPQIHARFAQAAGHDLSYGTIEGRVGGFAEDVAAFRATGGRGLNVTTPFKQDAFALADRLQPGALLAGAVNCLTFDQDGTLGANFDGVGLLRDITVNLGVAVRGRRVLMLGAGGATRGALQPLLEARPAALVVANRTLARAEELAGLFAEVGVVEPMAWDTLGGRFDIVVNATSASLHGEALTLPPGLFGADALAYDMTYGSGLTPFLRLAAENGALVADGLGMLVEQAAEAFALWRGVRPQTAPVIASLRAT